MKRYSYLQAIYMSFFSPKLYRDVANNWGGGTVLYLFILLMLCWAVMMFKYQPGINMVVRHFSHQYTQQIPELEIDKGELKTPEDKPYLIKNPNNDKLFLVIDTSGKYNSLKDVPPNTQVLITKKSMYYYDDNRKIQTEEIPTNVTWHIKPDEIKNFAIKFAGWAWVFLFPFLLAASFAYRLIQALLYAVIGKIFALIGGINLSYVKILKLTLVAITPTVLASTVLDWFYVTFPYELLLFFILSMAYLIFALLANKEKELPPQ